MAFELKRGETIADLLIRATKANTRELNETIMLHDGQGGEFGNMANHLKNVIEDRKLWYISDTFWTYVFGIVAAVAAMVALEPLFF